MLKITADVRGIAQKYTVLSNQFNTVRTGQSIVILRRIHFIIRLQNSPLCGNWGLARSLDGPKTSLVGNMVRPSISLPIYSFVALLWCPL